ncbi:hypothetical protein [Methyloprofundus sp.]|uniref:hypothetical protein n=1 Tax=Methyloprofundus sp. TaxID=2020875 RepID=UPI003D122C85
MSPKSFNSWLTSLQSSPAAEQAYLVLLAIQAINQEKKLSKQQKSLLLASIYNAMVTFLPELNLSPINSPFPLAKKKQLYAQYCVSIYAELANGFASCLSETSNLSTVQTLFFGLQSLISAYIHIAEVYQQVYPNFWKLSYFFYALASKLEIQDTNIQQHGYHSNTVSMAFKHLLALHHCRLDQQRPRAMQAISSCIEKHTSKMQIGKKIQLEKASRYSGLDLNTDNSPIDLSSLRPSENSSICYFSAYAAAIEITKNAVQEASGSGVIKSINREIILQTAKNLSMSQNRQFTRVDEQAERDGVIGFKQIIDQLQSVNSLIPDTQNKKNINQVDSRLAGGWSVPDIDLVSEGYESIDAIKMNFQQSGLLREEQSKIKQDIQNSLSQNIWGESDSSPKSDSSSNPEKLIILDSSLKGYKIIFDPANTHSKVQIGDIIGIDNKGAQEIGIVWRIKQLTDNKIQLGIKLLALESEISYISIPGHDSTYAWAIFLPGIKALNTADSIIINDSKFHCGEFINLHRANAGTQSCRLNKLLHLSSAAMHIELFDSTVMQ